MLASGLGQVALLDFFQSTYSLTCACSFEMPGTPACEHRPFFVPTVTDSTTVYRDKRFKGSFFPRIYWYIMVFLLP